MTATSAPAPPSTPPRATTRVGSRTRLIGAGIAYVWRFGELDFAGQSGRLLLRGENGTGKTTALETLWPFLLDLNSARLAAGKGRTTNFPALMRESVRAKKANGYVWFTVRDVNDVTSSFGARLEFSENGQPPVHIVPFRVRGRPLLDFALKNLDGSSLTAEQFKNAVTAAGGEVFADDGAYKRHLAKHVFLQSDARLLDTLAGKIRDVRNPSNLLDLSPEKAGDALRSSLPGVAGDVIDATANALAESDATRDAFARDAEAAVLLAQFAEAWTGHAAEVLANVAAQARTASADARQHERTIEGLTRRTDKAVAELARATAAHEELTTQIATAETEIETLKESEEYRQGGRLTELQNGLLKLTESASTAAKGMLNAAREATATSDRFKKQFGQLVADISDSARRAATAEPTKFSPKAPLTISASARPRLTVGDVSADPGVRIQVNGGTELHRTATAWETAGAAHRVLFDSSSLALIDFKGKVEPVAELKKRADESARETGIRAERDRADHATAETRAVAAAGAARTAIADWTRANSDLAAPSETDNELAGSSDDAWTVDDVDRLLADAEPNHTLAVARRWERRALQQSEATAARWRVQAGDQARAAKKLDIAAEEAEQAAADLRAGKLLPLPRPEWAGAGDDAHALGAALDWQAGVTDDASRDRLEAALGASGLLGATLDETGANAAARWSVTVTGPIAEPNLLSVIAVDAGHPHHDVATAVLARVRLLDDVKEVDGSDSGLIIGCDGAFRAGVLRGRAVPSDAPPPRASHVGARQRLAAAIARAEVLEAEASAARAEAQKCRAAADDLLKRADDISKRGRSFPSVDKLQDAEAARASAATRAQLSETAATTARAAVAERAEELRIATAEWAARARELGLPSTIEELRSLQERSKNAADLLARATEDMARHLPRFDDLHSELEASDADVAQRLVEAEARARTTHDEAARATTAVRVLEQTAGLAIREVHKHIEKVTRELAELKPIEATTKQQAKDATTEKTTAETLLQQAQEQQPAIVAKAAEALHPLHSTIKVDGVAAAFLGGEEPALGEGLIEQVERVLKGKKTLSKRALRERHDAVKPPLTGIWTLAPGDDCGELLTYLVSHHHGDGYSPPAAAERAIVLRDRAKNALLASDEKALTEFVIDRLPGAITTAWVQLQDWRRDVNKKMKEAAASSGVTVQVGLPLVDDLSPQSKTVYELTCKNDPIDLSDADKKRLGDALYALIHSTDGTMKEKVAAAVDIRTWVDVIYNVTRPVPGKPGEVKTSPWNSRTGLSSGERRLVVLAPMLAALAAAYDQLGASALRMVALDEVPAEVDERGKEGLARFIAALDLDLICTSHAWDGCPGAWDIDAHDMEAAGEDGTVVANPMLIRGLELLPGDDVDENGELAT